MIPPSKPLVHNASPETALLASPPWAPYPNTRKIVSGRCCLTSNECSGDLAETVTQSDDQRPRPASLASNARRASATTSKK